MKAKLFFGLAFITTVTRTFALQTDTPHDTIVFVNAHVITMESDTVLANTNVFVCNGRIIAISSSHQVPNRTMRTIDCSEKYLMPGLTDGHVHLYKEDSLVFRNAPLYLSKGITTVLNMRGDSTIYAWKRLINDRKIVAPTIYTSGEFINEPYVNSAESAAIEVLKQKEIGVDFLKFHEYWSDEQKKYLTTTGLSIIAFDTLMNTANRVGLPITGHGMYYPNFEHILEKKLSLAHLSAYQEYELIPDGTDDFQQMSKRMKWVLFSLFVISVALLVISKKYKPLIASLSLATTLLFIIWFNTVWIGNDWLIIVMLAVEALVVYCLVLLLIKKRIFHQQLVNYISKALLTILLIFLGYTMTYWTPLFFRNTSLGITSLAKKSNNIFVFTTMLLEGPSWYKMDHKEHFRYLSKPVLDSWSGLDFGTSASFLERWEYASPKISNWSLSQKVLLKHLKEHVKFVVGTDAMGFPFIVPGYSTHYELQLINQGGFTPYETLQTATVNPAKFLNMENTFGTIGVGKRADMVLLEKNPLDSLSALDNIAGVMVHGVWLSNKELEVMLKKNQDRN